MWHPRRETEFSRNGELGRHPGLSGGAGGWPWSSGKAGRLSQAGALSGIAEQTMGDPLACEQEAGDEQQEVWGALGDWGPPGGAEALQAHGQCGRK